MKTMQVKISNNSQLGFIGNIKNIKFLKILIWYSSIYDQSRQQYNFFNTKDIYST